MKVALTTKLHLSDEQTALMEMHTLLNIINVLVREFFMGGYYLGDQVTR